MIYSHEMVFDHYLLLIVGFLPFVYKYSFWFYVIQLKEYRRDRFKEYLNTPQWSSALVNIWSVVEFPLLLLSFYIFFDEPFESIIYKVLFYFLLFQNLFVFRKLISRKILKPKLTGRLVLTLLILLLWVSIWFFLIKFFNYSNVIYSYILSLYLLSPLIIFIIILFTLPFISYKKNKLINNAIKKSNEFNEVIKIGITWSYWKSSIKEYLSSILEQEWNTLKTPENINTELWVSDLIIKKLDNSYKYFVAEMWAYRVGEIDLLWKIVNHKYGFLTAIWNQHLWLFWSLEKIKKWKSEIINSVIKNNWTLYINRNNQEIRNVKFKEWTKIVKYWNYEWADTFFEILWVKEGKTKFNFEYNWTKSIFEVALIWEHNIVNISWVLAFCYDLWFKTSDLLKYLKNIKSPKNTLTIKNVDKYTIIDDTYNLSEAWLLAWLEVLNSYEWNKVLVVDDILELWKDAEKIHYNLWKKIASEKLADNIIFVWVNYKTNFINWLIDWWFEKEKILKTIDSNLESSTILFEWRNAGKYI